MTIQATSTGSSVSVDAQLRTLETELNEAYLERREAIRAVLITLLAAENGFILGPPGTAKSEMLETLCRSLNGAKYFRTLMDRQMGKEDLFGAIDVPDYVANGHWGRNITDTLADAHVALLDEALDVTTLIPTPTGWTTMGALAVGDTVLGTHGSPVTVLRTTEPADMRPCFQVAFSDGTSVVADAGHKWWAKRAYAGSVWREWTTAQLVDGEHVHNQFHLPPIQPLQMPEAKLPLDPYFVGLWLGNGSAKGASVYLRPEDAERAQHALDYKSTVLGFTNDRESLLDVSFAGNGIRRVLGELGMLHSKTLPNIFLRGSVAQRLRLLQGLMDTDGWTDGLTCILSNTNPDVIVGAAEVLRTLGITAVVSQTKDDRAGARGSHQPCFKVTFGYQAGLPPFLARKVDYRERKHARLRRIVSVTPVESRPVRCIGVDAPDNLFLAGLGMVPTHNCGNTGPLVMSGLLTALNERAYKPNGTWIDLPLISAFGASNYWLEEMPAAWDRFTCRFEVAPIREDANFDAFFSRAAGVAARPEVATTIDLTELRAAIDHDVPAVVIPASVREAIRQLRTDLMAESITVSDRRWGKTAKMIKASAYLAGRGTADEDDLQVLQHVLWEDPRDRQKVQRAVLSLTSPVTRAAVEMTRQLDEISAEIDARKGMNVSTSERAAYGGTAIFQVSQIKAELDTVTASASADGRGTAPLEAIGDQVTGLRTKIFVECMGTPPERAAAMA